MIVRIAHFHTLSPIGRDLINDALRDVPGIRACYHAAPTEGPGYVSVAIGDDDAAFEAAETTINERRVELGIEGKGPDEVTFYNVDHFVENI